MTEQIEQTSTESSSGNLFNKFAELPGGVQRVIIAVLVILVLIVVVFIQRLIQTEESDSED